MLKGWTLTDLVCPTCQITPLMREPAAQAREAGRSEAERIEFCGRCDGGPGRSSRSGSVATVPIQQQRPSFSIPNGFIPNGTDSPSSPSQLETSTRLPSISLPPPQSTSITQSDRASSLISSLLLRGYALLSETCPNPSCRGIPLVGHPRKREPGYPPEVGQEKRECVICGGVYDANGSVISRPSIGGGAEEGASAAVMVNGIVNGNGNVNVNGARGSVDLEAARRVLYEEGLRIHNAMTGNGARSDGLPQVDQMDTAPASRSGAEAAGAGGAGMSADMDVDAILAESLEQTSAAVSSTFSSSYTQRHLILSCRFAITGQGPVIRRPSRAHPLHTPQHSVHFALRAALTIPAADGGVAS
jgi:hypothetical protein